MQKALPVVVAVAVTFATVFDCAAATGKESLRPGMSISAVRALLLQDGWTAVRIDKKLAGNRENLFGDARLLFQAGFFEVESCTGIGQNYCFFNYQKNGECLRLITSGEYFSASDEPKLDKWTNECPE